MISFIVKNKIVKLDKEDYEKINSYLWHLDKNGYAQSSIGKMHRFIMNAKKGDSIVDHINGDKLDNRKENLRFVTFSQNAQNRVKKENCYSNYIGVTYEKNQNIWKCQIRINGLKKSYSFKIEEHAAYCYDCLALEHYGNKAKINGIELPEDFVEPVDKAKKKYKNITLTKSNTYHTTLPNKGKVIYIGTFKTKEEAVFAYNSKKIEMEERYNKEIKLNPILINLDGYPIIYTNKKEEIIVDDYKYYDLIKYSWYTKDGYVYGHVPGKNNVIMHRFLMNAKTNEIIDHINGNKLDNRLSNLRISNPTLNGHNKTKKQNASSKYLGVSYIISKKRFKAVITKDKKQYFIGTFVSEEDAAKARDKKAIELYGEYAKLNF